MPRPTSPMPRTNRVVGINSWHANEQTLLAYVIGIPAPIYTPPSPTPVHPTQAQPPSHTPPALLYSRGSNVGLSVAGPKLEFLADGCSSAFFVSRNCPCSYIH